MRKRALVLGASGGIGAALCTHLQARGDEVLSLSRSANGFDLTNPASLRDALAQHNGPFHTVLITSGILAPTGERPEKSLAEINADHMAKVMAVNAIGPALVLQNLPRLLPAKARCVVGVLTARVGSIGDNHLGGWYSYRAAKAAANQIVHTAAIEFARTHKQSIVVALHPGTVETPFTKAYSAHQKVTPDTAAQNLLGVLDQLTPAQTGQFFDWSGEPVAW